jgi:glycosyltransferase involved in cell wall biosynthesis
MKKIMVITDMDMLGSGYRTLTIPLMSGLAELGYEIKIIGFQYRGEEHWFDFSIIPAENFQDIFAIVRNLEHMWKPDVLIVLLDIPLQEQLLQQFQQRTFKYVGIMPIEAPPLCTSFAMALSQMDKALIISGFGTQEALRFGINAEHLQIGIDVNAWNAPTTDERKKLRDAFGLDDETFVVLTVADNQERKNLSRAMEIVADFIYDHYPVTKEWLDATGSKPKRKVQYLLVTREHFFAGWRLRDYAQEIGINLNLSIFERGISHQELWGLYAISDVFLLTSKAEGLGMPVLEAMAMKVPVAGTNFAAIAEHLADGKRGHPIDYYTYPDFAPYVDPFGNGFRVFANRENGYLALKHIQKADVSGRTNAAYKYVSKKHHEISIQQLHNALESIK